MNKLLKQTVIQFLVYIIAIFLIVFFVLLPTSKDISKNKKVLADNNTKLNNLNVQLETLNKLSADNSDINQKIEIISKYLPDNLDSSSFIVETEGLAKSLNIVIDSFSIASPTESNKNNGSSNRDQSQFMVTLNCSFGQAMSFIEQMEKLSRFNTVSSVSASSISADQIAIQLAGFIYNGK